MAFSKMYGDGRYYHYQNLTFTLKIHCRFDFRTTGLKKKALKNKNTNVFLSFEILISMQNPSIVMNSRETNKK